ncbi:MAG: thioredoxin-dependent thiol peroxidase [Candidatus Cryptobacteroides sp.]|nr:thioredoxin-dependent thiol peroxidase [Bacteroidales bacterium]
MIKEGDRIPDFSVIDQNGNVFTSENLLGSRTVLYFYPKDSTPGCTAEACNLRDNIGALGSAGYKVVGVSKDSDASHRKFIEKYQLPFTLLSDKSTEMLQAFGAWGEKKMCGKVCVGTLRKTFIINAEGIVERIIDKVDTKNHTAQIL